MKVWVCLSIIVAGTISIADVSWAQISGVTRGAHVELAYVAGTELVGRAIDDDYASGPGAGDYLAEVVTDSSSCSATHSSTATVAGDSIVVSGVLAIDSAQSVPGIQCFFHAWASLSITLDVETSGTFRLGGVLSDNAHVSYDLLNIVTWERTFVQIPAISGDYQQTVNISQAGSYELNIFLDELYSSQELGSRSVFAEFELVLAATGVVPTETSSWGQVKALWK
jgi:hypothetical protein